MDTTNRLKIILQVSLLVLLIISLGVSLATWRSNPSKTDTNGLAVLPELPPSESAGAPELAQPISPLQQQPAQQITRTITARMSWYYPNLGGTNCGVPLVNGQCNARMASGQPWQSWVGLAAACPRELPFYSVIQLPGGERFVCLDRGSKIVTLPDSSIWLDLLVEVPPVPYGSMVQVEAIYP